MAAATATIDERCQSGPVNRVMPQLTSRLVSAINRHPLVIAAEHEFDGTGGGDPPLDGAPACSLRPASLPRSARHRTDPAGRGAVGARRTGVREQRRPPRVIRPRIIHHLFNARTAPR